VTSDDPEDTRSVIDRIADAVGNRREVRHANGRMCPNAVDVTTVGDLNPAYLCGCTPHQLATETHPEAAKPQDGPAVVHALTYEDAQAHYDRIFLHGDGSGGMRLSEEGGSGSRSRPAVFTTAKGEGRTTPTRAGRAGDSQPMPRQTGTGPVVHEQVMRDLSGRLALGVRRYGTPLRAFNGRNSTQDAYEEILDLAVYLRQSLDEERELADALQVLVGAARAWLPMRPSDASTTATTMTQNAIATALAWLEGRTRT
jgi:hypothetical protein